MIFSHPFLRIVTRPTCNIISNGFCFVLHSSEVIFSFLIKKSRQKAIEIETAFFHPLGNPNGRTLDHFFYASHIRHNFPLRTDTYINELVEIFLKLSMKTVQVNLIIGTTLVG